MKKSTYKNSRVIGLFVLLISVLLTVFYSELIDLSIIVGKKLSPDHRLKQNTIDLFKQSFAGFIILLAGLGILFVTNVVSKIPSLLNSFFRVNDAFRFFFTDERCRIKQLPMITFVVATFFGVSLHFYVLAFFEPPKEGILERYSSLLFPISALLLLLATGKLKNRALPRLIHKKSLYFLIGLALVLFLIYGEEISWGQTFYNWESPEVFQVYNFQYETNAHNFFNPLFQFIYPIAGMGLFLGLFLMWFFPKDKPGEMLTLFMPHQILFFLAFQMACSTFLGHSEIFEQLLAIFILLYSIRILLCLTHPPKEAVLAK